jgi:RNA polymerase sigma-70 factor (ECF subfamily)
LQERKDNLSQEPTRNQAQSDSDFELVRSFIDSGNKDAFRQLVERHLTSLRRLLYVFFKGNRHDMEDAQQEILLALYQNITSFRFQSSFATYFYRFSRNKAIDLLRQKAKERRISKRANISLFQKTQPDPVDELIKKQESAILRSAFNRLKEQERLLLLMRYVEELSIAEISDITGLRSGTIKSGLHRSREKLARILGERP